MYQKHLKWLWVLAPLLSFIVFRYLLDFNGLYGQDSHEYHRYTGALVAYYQGGPHPGRFFWPVNFPFFASLVSWIGMDNSFVLQLLTSVYLCVFLYFLMSALKLQFPSHTCSYGVPIFAYLIFFSPLVFRSGIVIMSESLAMALIMAALYYFLVSRQCTKINVGSYLFILASILAIGTRYASVVLVAPLVLYWIWCKRRSLNLRNCLTLLFVAVVAISPNLFIKLDFSHGFYDHDLLARWSLKNYLKHSFLTDNGVVFHNYPNLVYYGVGLWHLKLFWWLLPLTFHVLKLWKKDKSIFVIAILSYVLFLLGIPEQNARYLILLTPFLAILFFPAFIKLYDTIQSKVLKGSLIAAVAIIQTCMIYDTMKVHLDWNKLERYITHEVNRFEKTTLYTFAIDQSLRTYDCVHTIKNLYAEELSDFVIGGLLLFNEESFEVQWKDLSPMRNFEKLKRYYVLQESRTFSDGWVLYHIVQKK